MTLTAYCEQCDETTEVYADELFEFDCRCTRCDSLLVLQEEDEDEAGERPTVLYDERTRADGDATLPPEPGPDPDDPYALAAHALDSSVTGRLERAQVTVELPVPDLPPDEVADDPPPTGALTGSGEQPDAEPLPSWDGGDTQQVEQLAREEPFADQLPPLENLDAPASDDALTFADDAEAALTDVEEVDDVDAALGEVEVLHLDGRTAGRGSRTYEAQDLEEELPTLVLPDDPTRGDGNQAEASVPQSDSRLFSDLDWLALINDALPEDGEEGDEELPGKARVYIRVPEEMAPTDDANPDQVQRFRETMTQLEEGGSLEAMLENPTRDVQRFDPEQTGKLKDVRAGEHTGEPPTGDGHTAAWEQRLELEAAARGEPVPVTQARTQEVPVPTFGDDDGADQETISEANQQQGPTQAWQPAPRGSGSAAHRRPPSGRRPTPRTVIEQFQRSDLDPGLACARDVGSPQADHFRRLYQRIFQAHQARVVLVTSPGPDEGKTTVASNLAIVGARIPGGGALLVDADPRGSGVLRAFGQRQQFDGLLEALQTSRDLGEYVVGFNLGTLDVIPLGLPSSDAVELLASERMEDFVASVRQAYGSSVVIIDSCSLLHAALAPLVDGVIVVARAGRTKREDLKRTIEELGPDRVLGVVLNDAIA